MSTYIVAITGASGSIYAQRLLHELINAGHHVQLIVSTHGEQVLNFELGLSLGGNLFNKQHNWHEMLNCDKTSLELFDNNDISASIASGSFPKAGMIVIPCSMGTLGRITTGTSSNLIERAADVTLKERQQLILVTRETPLNLIHLRNMVAATEAGAEIMPPMPFFYHHPTSIDDLVNAFVGRLLDRLGIQNQLTRKWNPES